MTSDPSLRCPDEEADFAAQYEFLYAEPGYMTQVLTMVRSPSCLSDAATSPGWDYVPSRASQCGAVSVKASVRSAGGRVG